MYSTNTPACCVLRHAGQMTMSFGWPSVARHTSNSLPLLPAGRACWRVRRPCCTVQAQVRPSLGGEAGACGRARLQPEPLGVPCPSPNPHLDSLTSEPGWRGPKRLSATASPASPDTTCTSSPLFSLGSWPPNQPSRACIRQGAACF